MGGEPWQGKKEAVRTVVDVVIAAVVTFLLLRVFFNIVIVEGSSMKPTLQDGSFIIVQCQFYTLEKGDIVLCRTNGYDEPIIKRVIAMEGDTVDIDFASGSVYLNGAALDEPYILEPTYRNLGTKFPVKVEEGCLFLLGDNRNDSCDSRAPQIGLVKEDEVIGRYLKTITPGG